MTPVGASCWGSTWGRVTSTEPLGGAWETVLADGRVVTAAFGTATAMDCPERFLREMAGPAVDADDGCVYN